MNWLKYLPETLFLLACSVYILFFCIVNNDVADVDLVFTRLEGIKVELIAVTSFLLGGLMGLAAIVPLLLKQRKKHKVKLSTQKMLQQTTQS